MNIAAIFLVLSLIVLLIEAANENNAKQQVAKKGGTPMTYYKLTPMKMVRKKSRMNRNKNRRKNWRKNRPQTAAAGHQNNSIPDQPQSQCTVTCPEFRCTDWGVGVVPPVGPLVGATKTACGKRYFVSKVEQSFQSAGVACCELGMTLVSLDSRSEYACVAAMVKESPGIFWTAGSDMGCDGEFIWCDGSEESFSNDAAWLAGAPSSQNTYEEHCVTLNVPDDNAKTIGLDDDDCEMSFRYICELPEDVA